MEWQLKSPVMIDRHGIISPSFFRKEIAVALLLLYTLRANISDPPTCNDRRRRSL
jgi:hypothetical protein